MTLTYLDFDFSDDSAGRGTFDAMASAPASRLPALLAEVAQVMRWAHQSFGLPGLLEDDGQWDYELQGVQEVASPLEVIYDAQTDQVSMQAAAPGEPRTTLTLTLSGSPAFCESFRQAFAIAD